MKKTVISMFCGALVVSMALPAMAETTISGYFRTVGIAQNTGDANGIAVATRDADAESFVVQRLRAKVTNKVNDFATIVWFGEIDTDFGQSNAKDADGDLGKGGKPGADGINLETKNLYLDLKPGKEFPLAFRVGIQGVADNFQNNFINEDVAAVVTTGTFNNLGLAAGWSKFDEGTLAGEDDSDLYFTQLGYKVSDAAKVGFDLYYNHMDGKDDTAESDSTYLFTMGPYFNANVAGIGLDGFLMLQKGKIKNNGNYDDVAATKEDMNVSAYAWSLAASKKVIDPLTVGARIMYFSKDKDVDATNSTKNNFAVNNIGALAFMNEGLNIFLTDALKINGANDNLAFDAVNNGYGLMGGVIKAKYDVNANVYTKVAMAYFRSLIADNHKTAVGNSKDGDDDKTGRNLGYEVACEVGSKLGESGAVLSLRGSYAGLGNYFDRDWNDKNARNIQTADNAYMAALMLNLPY